MATTAVEVAEATPVAGVVMGEATTSNSPTSVAVADEVSTAEIALADAEADLSTTKKNAVAGNSGAATSASTFSAAAAIAAAAVLLA